MIKISGLDDTFKMLDEIDKSYASDFIKTTTQKAYENLKFFAKPHHVDGTLERNIRHKVKSNAGIVWIADDNMLTSWHGKEINYAEFVLFGSKAHEIKPNNKKALRFSLGGFIFSKSVHHPGYKGDDFIKKAIQKTLTQLER